MKSVITFTNADTDSDSDLKADSQSYTGQLGLESEPVSMLYNKLYDVAIWFEV